MLVYGDTSGRIGEDVFVNECMLQKSSSVSKPCKNVGRRDLLREIRKEKTYTRSSGSDGGVFAMD